MRKIQLMFYLVLLPVVSSAQDRIGYSYDASGNRIKREIVMQVPKAMQSSKTFPLTIRVSLICYMTIL